MIRNFRRSAAILAAGAIALTAPAAMAAPASDGAEMTVFEDSITVEGEILDGLGTLVIGVDANGDAVGSGYGVDLVEYNVSFPRPGTVRFGLAIGDANPATGHGPQSVEYGISPTIGNETIELTATANADTYALEGDMRYGVQTCEPDATGVNQCTTSDIKGGYEDGLITWDLKTNALPGAQINGGTAEANPTITTGLTGGLIFNGGLFDTMSVNALGYMPSATLLVDGVAVDTQDLGDTGYEVSASGFAAGDHTVAVELCDAAVDCTTVDLGVVTTS